MPFSRQFVEDRVPAVPPFPTTYIHPDKTRKIKASGHPLGHHPALPAPVAKEAFSTAYQQMMQKLERYTGVNLHSTREVMTLPMMQVELLEKVREIESQHVKELEDLAVKVVTELPQFSGVADAIERGHLVIEAKLVIPEQIDLDQTVTQAEQDEEEVPDEEQAAEISAELDEMVGRRKFINHLIQGGAMASAYAFHMAENELTAIHPHLVDDYGALMALAEFGHWVTPDELIVQAVQHPESHGGKSEVKTVPAKEKGEEEVGPEGAGEEEVVKGKGPGEQTIVFSQAQTFPMLVHEIVKGLLEYLSYPDEDAPENVQRVQELADVIDDEPYQLMLGPELWRRLLAGLGKDQHHFPKVYDKLIKMPTTEFNDLMKGLMAKSPEAAEKLKRLAA